MRVLERIVVLTVAALGLPSAAWAQAISIEAEASEQRVVTGDMLTLDVRAIATADGEIQVDIPPIAGFREVRRSQGESTSFSWTNQGQTIRREQTMRVELEAIEAGKQSIPAITARLGSQVARSTPIPVEVLAASSPADAQTAVPNAVISPGPGEEQLFVRYRLDKAEAFLGEQVLLDLEIFTNASFNLDESKGPPELDGFWKEIVDQPDRLTARTEKVDGRPYRVYRLWRVALFALEAGERTIPEQTLYFSVNRSIFSSGRRLKRQAPALKLEIKPLPLQGRPKGFSSTNVGEYELTAKLDRNNVPAGKAVVLTLSLRGAGNIQNAKLPIVEDVPGFRVFPPTLNDDVAKRSSGVFGEKRAEVLLMPLAGGRQTVPSFELTVFKPSKGAYERLVTPSMAVLVEGDPSQVASTGPDPKADDEPSTPRGRLALAPIRFRSALTDRRTRAIALPTLATGLLTPPGLFLLFVLLEGLWSRSRQETPASRRKKAAREARQRIAKAEEALARGELQRAYAETSEALLALASERAGENLRGLARPDLRSRLIELGAENSVVTRLSNALDRCDYGRFAPGAEASVVRQAVDEGRSLLAELEPWSKEERR